MELLIFLPIILLIIESLINGEASRRVWNSIIVLYIIGLAYAFGSRCVGCAVYDDYANVYLNQGRYLRDIGFDGFFSTPAATTEYFFYLIFWIITKIVKEVYWLWAVALLSFTFLFLGLRKMVKNQEIVLILTLASIGLSTQLVRQYLAWSMMFYLITLIKSWNRTWLLLPAVFVHHSSVVLLAKYYIGKWINWKHLLLIFMSIYFLKDILIDYFLNIDHYYIRFLVSDALENDILDYNKMFIHRAVLLSFLAVIFPKYRSFILLSVGIFIAFIGLPLIPVRLNVLILSHSYGIFFVLIMRKLRLQKIKFIYIFVLGSLIVRILFTQTGEFGLWKAYNTII